MVQILSNETLGSLIRDELDVLRGAGNYDAFRSIATLTVAWLQENSVSTRSVEQHLSVRPEQLLSIVLFARSDAEKVSGQNRTWAKVAAAHRDLDEALKKHYAERRDQSQHQIASTYLANLSECCSVYELDTASIDRVISRLRALTPDSRTPRDFKKNVISQKAFSEGLRESLLAYNEELRYLTVGQIEALEKSLVFRRLWVQGPAGCGKTVFAVEAAYRALRAGARTLIVYRSTQFRYIFAKLLESVAAELYLLPHLDFMYLLRQVELYGAGSKEYWEIVSSHFPSIQQHGEMPTWDMAIVDDCGTFETHMPYRMLDISQLSHRSILLAAPDQIVSHIMFDFGSDVPEPDKDRGLGTLNDVAGVLDQELEAPEGYEVVQLTRNLRNASSIADYIGSVTQATMNAGVKTPGVQRMLQSSWESIAADIVACASEGLMIYEPGRIKVIVDPHLWHPALCNVTADDYHDARAVLIEELEPMSAALLVATMGGSFLHTTMEADDELRRVLAEHQSKSPLFIATDGEAVLPVYADALATEYRAAFSSAYQNWGFGGRIDAMKLLEEDALADPFEASNAIMIYQAPLFIGMEADMVIYVRNQDDPFETQRSLSSNVVTRLRAARLQHHFLSMSRAKHHLIDLMITR